jgi:SAM-dependent methyltransferase
MKQVNDTWNSGDPYEYFMGRWSKLMAPVFLDWLNFSHNMSWLDLGCGTGALSEAIYRTYNPAHLSCVDPSEDFLKKARERLSGDSNFFVGTASNIPSADDTFDIIVSGLALNFFNDLAGAFSEMKRVLKPKGTVAAYVWDYADRMDFLRIFWNAAREIDSNADTFDEGIRFPICNSDKLKDLFGKAGLANIETSYLDIPTAFKNFDDYWNPFLGGQGPAPSYVASLPVDSQNKLKSTILTRLPIEPDGTINLLARVIAVRGIHKQ